MGEVRMNLDLKPIVAIDPGPINSAMVVLFQNNIKRSIIVKNELLLEWLRGQKNSLYYPLAIEMIASFGMPVGAEVFETCLWIGRFIEGWGGEYKKIYRKEVKLELCGTTKAKDPNIRQAIIDLFGPGKEKAIGKKKTPGPLYGLKADMWAALAVAITYKNKIMSSCVPHGANSHG